MPFRQMWVPQLEQQQQSQPAGGPPPPPVTPPPTPPAGGQVPPAGGLLDQFANAGGGDPPPVVPGGAPPAGGQVPAGPVTLESLAQMLAHQAQSSASDLDRRINQVVQTLRTEFGTQQPPPATPPAGAPPVAPAPVGLSSSDLQEARGVYREFVNDEVRFLGPAERDLAQSLAGAAIAERLGAGDSPERAGRSVAKSVAEQVKALRVTYENATIAALRQRGMITEGAGTGLPLPAGTNPVPSQVSAYQKGADRAKRMYADRVPQGQSTQA